MIGPKQILSFLLVIFFSGAVFADMAEIKSCKEAGAECAIGFQIDGALMEKMTNFIDKEKTAYPELANYNFGDYEGDGELMDLSILEPMQSLYEEVRKHFSPSGKSDDTAYKNWFECARDYPGDNWKSYCRERFLSYSTDDEDEDGDAREDGDGPGLGAVGLDGAQA